MRILSRFRLVILLAFAALASFSLSAEAEIPMPPMPVLPEDYLEDDDTGGEKEDSTTTNMVSSITFSYTDDALKYLDYAWYSWDSRVRAAK